MRYRRVDQVQKEIIRELNSLQIFSVMDTSMLGKGFGDIVVGFRGLNFIFELKNTEGGLLTESEKRFHEEWKGQVTKVHSTRAILEYIAKWMRLDDRRRDADTIHEIMRSMDE